jgi:large subunit ribosomal protein L9
MQVILMEKVVNLGGLGDVVKVKDGFARNFLIPQGKAKRATPENLKEFETRRADLEKKANEQLTGAQERAEKVEGLKVDIAQKAGVDGRLFGSVTNADIAEAVAKASGLQIKKAEIRMPSGPLKHIGEYPITSSCTRTCSRTSRCTSSPSSKRVSCRRKGRLARPFFFSG